VVLFPSVNGYQRESGEREGEGREKRRIEGIPTPSRKEKLNPSSALSSSHQRSRYKKKGGRKRGEKNYSIFSILGGLSKGKKREGRKKRERARELCAIPLRCSNAAYDVRP